MLNALAVVCIRNEEINIRRCLKSFISEGIDVLIMDNGSTDKSTEIAKEFLGRGLIGIEELPWNGTFSLSDQLRIKKQVSAHADHDWIIHADADEWLQSPLAGQSLHEAICEADAAGYTCINFHELVFVPMPSEDFFDEDYAERMITYYFFQPTYPRLNRAWKRSANLDNLKHGGHLLSGDKFNLCHQDFILRHYIALSNDHARSKYMGRHFSNEDISKRWHGNRLNMKPDNLSVKESAFLKKLTNPKSRSFDLSSPIGKHFWEW